MVLPLFVLLLLESISFVFFGCSDETTQTINSPQKSYNAKKLLETKCASCHNLDMPASSFPDEIAPPMMAVTFHVHDFMQGSSKSEKTLKSIAFVQDYVMNPSRDKTFCDEQSLKDYGLMPSQKGKLTKDELEAIAKYLFNHYTQENLLKIIEEKQIYDALSMPEKVARRYKCISCHKAKIFTISPPLSQISARYVDDDIIKTSILKGSRNKWEQSRGASMPAFKDLNRSDLEYLLEWIRLEK